MLLGFVRRVRSFNGFLEGFGGFPKGVSACVRRLKGGIGFHKAS